MLFMKRTDLYNDNLPNPSHIRIRMFLMLSQVTNTVSYVAWPTLNG